MTGVIFVSVLSLVWGFLYSRTALLNALSDPHAAPPNHQGFVHPDCRRFVFLAGLTCPECNPEGAQLIKEAEDRETYRKAVESSSAQMDKLRTDLAHASYAQQQFMAQQPPRPVHQGGFGAVSPGARIHIDSIIKAVKRSK